MGAIIQTIRPMWLVTYAVILLLAFSTGGLSVANARGFCNIDRLGGKDLQRDVTDAGAEFFQGGSVLMTMFAAIERGDEDKAKLTGSSAAESFGRAKRLYESVAAKMGEISDDKLSSVNPELVAAIGQTGAAVPLFSEIARTAQGAKAPTNLMILCSVETQRMLDATNTFLNGPHDQERYFATLLSAWGRALYVGRAVSAFFAAAGGER